MTNFATLALDENGRPYITQVGTGKRLYRHPNCPTCGIARYSYKSEPMPSCDESCDTHPNRRVQEMFS